MTARPASDWSGPVVGDGGGRGGLGGSGRVLVPPFVLERIATTTAVTHPSPAHLLPSGIRLCDSRGHPEAQPQRHQPRLPVPRQPPNAATLGPEPSRTIKQPGKGTHAEKTRRLRPPPRSPPPRNRAASRQGPAPGGDRTLPPPSRHQVNPRRIDHPRPSVSPSHNPRPEPRKTTPKGRDQPRHSSPHHSPPQTIAQMHVHLGVHQFLHLHGRRRKIADLAHSVPVPSPSGGPPDARPQHDVQVRYVRSS